MIASERASIEQVLLREGFVTQLRTETSALLQIEARPFARVVPQSGCRGRSLGCLFEFLERGFLAEGVAAQDLNINYV